MSCFPVLSLLSQYARPGIVRGGWLPSEDNTILAMVARGYKWRDIAEILQGRTSESLRDRYVNHLDPSLKKSKWTEEEDNILFTAQLQIGNKWTEIRKLLPGRSVNSIKNRYHNNKKSQMKKWNNIGTTRSGESITKRVCLGDLESKRNPSQDGRPESSEI